jgi:hypothetical protein
MDPVLLGSKEAPVAVARFRQPEDFCNTWIQDSMRCVWYKENTDSFWHYFRRYPSYHTRSHRKRVSFLDGTNTRPEPIRLEMNDDWPSEKKAHGTLAITWIHMYGLYHHIIYSRPVFFVIV